MSVVHIIGTIFPYTSKQWEMTLITIGTHLNAACNWIVYQVQSSAACISMIMQRDDSDIDSDNEEIWHWQQLVHI